MTGHDDQAPGVAPCHGCGADVLFAVPGDSDSVIALDPDDQGALIAWEDSSGTARWRQAKPSEQLALGEYLFRFHDPVCPALAEVRPLASAKSVLSRRSARHAATERRHASAR